MSILDRFKKTKDTNVGAPKVAKDSGTAEQATTKKATKADKKAEKKNAKGTAPKKSTVSVNSKAHSVLIQPIITEKATLNGIYVFEVAPNANKSEIGKAIKDVYGVTPKTVRVLNVKGKEVRWNYRRGKRKDWKKAIVRLQAGETINVYEGT